jgi:hypothetical protein
MYLDITLNMNVKTLTISLLILIFTSSCSGTYRAYYQTLKIAFSEQKNIKMALIEVEQSKIDVISVKRGKRATVIMALAYLENDQHKWVSSDNAMLIMEKGRIIRTLGLIDDLLYLSNTDSDPLKSWPNLAPAIHEQQRPIWSFTVDLTGDQYGYPVESTFNQASEDTVEALGLNIKAILYVETLSYNAPANYIQLNKSWENHYWYTKNGQLVKSIQKFSPLSESLEITYLSRIARLNK